MKNILFEKHKIKKKKHFVENETEIIQQALKNEVKFLFA
jgi:hypothetical protein